MAENTIGTAYVQIEPSARGIAAKTQKVLGGEMALAGNGAGISLGSALKSSLVKYVSAAAIGGAIFKSINIGAELQQNLGGTEAVFGNYAANIQKTAQLAYKNMGLSASDYMATANKMGSLFQGSGISQQKSLTLTADAMQRAADVASVMGIDATMAMESIAGAAKGNFTMMDNLGVAMNATTLQAYALEKGVNFNWNTASNAEKAELAMRMFMERTAQYAGNYAREADDTLSGSLEAMQGAWANFMGNLSMGQGVGDSMRALATTASTYLFKNLMPAIGNIFKSLPEAMGVFIREGAPQLGASIMGLMNDLAGTFKNSGDLFNKLMPSLTDLSGMLLNGANSFVNVGLALLQNLAQGIANGLPMFIQEAPKIVTNLANIINVNAPKLIVAGLNIVKTLAIGIIKAIPTLIANIPAIFNAFIAAWSAISWGSLGKAAIASLGKGAIAEAGSLTASIGAKMTAVTQKIVAPFTKASTLVRGAITKIKAMFPLSIGKIFSNLKIPHINVSGGKAPFGIGGLGSLPKFNVKWNAEGGIFDSAQIFGYGVGEKGAEAIIPLDRFWAEMADIKAAATANNGGGTAVIMLDGAVIAKSTINYINGQVQRYGTSPLNV